MLVVLGLLLNLSLFTLPIYRCAGPLIGLVCVTGEALAHVLGVVTTVQARQHVIARHCGLCFPLA